MTKLSTLSHPQFSHTLPGQHLYHNVLFFGYTPPDTLDQVKNFQVRQDDVFVVSYPKAGTAWLQEITWLLMNNGNICEAKQKPVYQRSPFLEFKDTTRNEVGLDIAADLPSPRVINSHLQLKLTPKEIMEKKPKIILLFRNPKDVCVSYYNFYRSSSLFGDFKGGWSEFLRMFMHGHVDHGSWFDFTKSWWPLAKESNVKLIFYENMKRNLLSEVKDLAHFLGKDDLDDEVLSSITDHCGFQQMQTNPITNHEDVYSIDSGASPLLRKGKVGDWKNQFTVKQNEDFDSFYKNKMSDTEIPFAYSK